MSLKDVFIVKESSGGFQEIINLAAKRGFRVVSVEEMKQKAPDAVQDYFVDPTPQPGPFGGTVTSIGDNGNNVDEAAELGRFVANHDFSKMAFYPWEESGHYYFWSRKARAWHLDAEEIGVPELADLEGRDE